MTAVLYLGLALLGGAVVAVTAASAGVRLRSDRRELEQLVAAGAPRLAVEGEDTRTRRAPWVVPSAVGLVALGLTRSLPLALLAAAAAVAGPTVAARHRESTRRRRFETELPDGLDLLASSLEAGSPLVQAMELVAADGDGPLAEEFARILADNRLGASLVDAMDDSAARVGSRDFGWCVKAVRAQQEFGASLSGVLRTLADFMRWRDELRGEVRALTAEGRVSAYVLISLPFMIGGWFALVNPSYFGTLVSSGAGAVLLGVAGVLMAVGSVWMSRIVKVEV